MGSALRVSEAAERYRDDVVRFLRDLVAIPSPSGQEREVAERIRAEMRAVDLDQVFIDDLGTVVGRVGSGSVKILYDSHIDTVGVGDVSAWNFDPFVGKLEGEVIFGRGASDNKAAIATMVYGARLLKDLGLTGDFTLYLAGTVMEEDCDGLGLQYLIENSGVRPDYVVLGECTNLDVYRGHRGRVEMRVVTKGRSCHASAPERGNNAIYQMVPIVEGISRLGERLKDDPFLGKGTVAVTKVECRTPSLNAVPDECTIFIDRRLTHGETVEVALDELKAIAAPQGGQVDVLHFKAVSYTGREVTAEKYFPTWVLPPEHPLVRGAVTAGEVALGSRPSVSKWIFSTNGVASMGRLKIPSIGFGPGEERFSHSVEDHVLVSHLIKAMAFYAVFPGVLVDTLSQSS